METISINRSNVIKDGTKLHQATYVHYYPASMQQWIDAGSDEVEVFKRSRLASLITAAERRADGHRHEISRDTLKDTLGNGYRGYIDMLRNARHITINDSYSNNSGSNFCKRYIYNKRHLASDMVKVKFIVTETVADTLNKIPTDKHSLRCEREIMVSDIDYNKVADSDVFRVSSDANRVNRGDYLPNTPKQSSREYNATVMAHNVVKEHFKWRNGDVVVNVDIRSAYPTFLGILAGQDGIDVGTYRKNVASYDLYDSLKQFYVNSSDVWAEVPRNEWKVTFNRFLNSKAKVKKSKKWDTMRDFLTFFANSEEFTGWVVTFDSIWKRLENVENALMVGLEGYALVNSLRYVRQHDGFLSDVTGADTLAAYLKKLGAEQFGAIIEIKKVLLGATEGSVCEGSHTSTYVSQKNDQNAYEAEEGTCISQPKNADEIGSDWLIAEHLKRRLEKVENDLKAINADRKRQAAKLHFGNGNRTDLMKSGMTKRHLAEEKAMLLQRIEGLDA